MDASASGADEIGAAMQKAAATATEAGLSFEWLGAYIATISEKTRQAPEVIGTSLNSMMSRLQSIKQMGYNEEDETKINDISKALNKIDVAIMDNEGNWRDMSDIFMDIAMQWTDLDDKTRAYIATTMAGTRQKNYFLTLMNDLSKVTDETGDASRAMELYEGAMNAAGSAAEKYAIYEESVTASNARMRASFEKLYSLFSSDLLKGWYDFWGNTSEQLYSFVTGESLFYDYSGIISQLDSQVTQIRNMRDEYEVLYYTKERTSAQDSRMAEIVETLSGKYHPLKEALTDVEGAFKKDREALDAMNDELERSIDLWQTYSEIEFNEKIEDTTGLENAWKHYSKAKDFEGLKPTIETIVKGFYQLDPDILTDKQWNKISKDIQNGFSNILNSKTNPFFNLYYEKSPLEEYLENYVMPDEKLYLDLADYIKVNGDSMIEAWNRMRIYSLNPAIDNMAAEVEQKFSEVFGKISVQPDYRNMSQGFKDYSDEIMKLLVDQITLKDWENGIDFVNAKIISLSYEAMEEFANLNNGAKYLIEDSSGIDTDDQDMVSMILQQRLDLISQINEFNEKWGTELSFDDIMELSFPVANMDDAEGKTLALQEKIDNLYKSVRASIDEANLQSKRDGGWAREVEHIGKILEGADLTEIQGMIEVFANLKNDSPDIFNAMAEDLDGLNEIIALFADGEITEADINKALEIFNNRVKFASENGENAATAIKSVRDALNDSFDERKIKEAAEANFSSQRAELQKFLPDLETGKAFDEDGLFAYLASLDDGMLDALYEFYPPLEEALELINSTDLTEKQEGIQLLTQAILAMGDAWTVYAEKYREAQESEIDDDEGLEIMQNLGKSIESDGIEGYREAFSKLTKEEQEWVEANSKAHKKIMKAWEKGEDGVKDNEKAMKKLNREIKKMELDKLAESGEIWEEVADIADEGVDTEEELVQAYGAFQEKLDEIVEAQGDLNFVMSATDKTTDDYTDAISNLESVCGFAIDSEQDLALAQMFLASQMDTATMSSATLLNYLMGISGSTFSAANWETELAALAASGDAAAICMMNLIANIRSIDGARINYKNGVFNVSGLGNAAIRRSGSSGGASSGAGGGGGGSDSSDEMSEIEKMLDLMEQIQKLREHQMNLIDANRGYYEEMGYLSSVVKSYEEERKAIEENNKVLEENIRKIETLLPAKQKEVAAMDTADKEYEQAKSDLEALQDAHQDYTLQLLENKTAVEALTNSIKEQENEIRDMEIELRETILEAIEDREELNERMLQGRIDVENEILDAITARYEKERDLAIETAEAKIEALEAESDALDEQLQKRKDLAEQEDKQAQLAQLQAKLARISADPTRKKEELELRKQIEELREEMAWDLAEDEVEAQQEAIDQQITSLEDYIEYVEEYYEDLFQHPQKLIEEMKMIIAKTDEEIIEWLKKNSEEYAASTDAAQEDMVNSWNEMLMDMHGSIESYWDEVEEIIAGGDEAIIAFLKAHSADYKAAGKLQAEAYVDEWKKQLEDLRRAYEDFYTEVQQTDYITTRPSTGSSSNSGSSGSAGGGKKWYVVSSDGTQIAGGFNSEAEAIQKRASERAYWYNSWQGAVHSHASTASSYEASYNKWMSAGIQKFLKGGLANFTGPAWLDGTKSAPERILSPYQTKLFEDMIATLHMIKVQVPAMPMNMYSPTDNAQAYSVGDIIVNVDSLTSDTDYAEMAERVMEEIMTRMTRGAAVGGIRITR